MQRKNSEFIDILGKPNTYFWLNVCYLPLKLAFKPILGFYWSKKFSHSNTQSGLFGANRFHRV
jgi:hypothetical protein